MATYSTIILMPTTILNFMKKKKQRQIQPGNKLMVIHGLNCLT